MTTPLFSGRRGSGGRELPRANMTSCNSPTADSFSPSAMSMSSSPSSSLCTASTGTPSCTKPAKAPRIQVILPKNPRQKGEPLLTPTSTRGPQLEVPVTPSLTSQQFKTQEQIVITALKQRRLDFPINEECTCLTLHPDGRFVLAGFSDGTLRIFDLETGGKLGKQRLDLDKDDENQEELCFDDAFESEEGLQSPFEEQLGAGETVSTSYAASSPCEISTNSSRSYKTARTRLVSSKQFQFFGAVSSQLHARGVHTDLLMHVEVSQDGQYCFAGVTRGSMELHAVYLGHLLKRQPHKDQNVLDFLRVHVHSDAKIKGFGSCTRVMPKKGDTILSRPKYLLLTGKGIKNIHIWSFEPPVYDATGDVELEPAKWENLYDHATNGNTISLLSFAYLPQSNALMAISKSDKQKIRLWDLSREQEHSTQHGATKRPKRPHYKDVYNSENAIAIAGNDFCVCGGNGMYNQMSMVSLEQPESMFNHTELALPVVGDTEACKTSSVTTQSSSSRRRRPQRGDLKQVVRAATMVNDASHVLLELDDRALLHYTTHHSSLNQLPRLERLPESIGVPELPSEFYSRSMCLGKLYDQVVVCALSIYNKNTGRGSISVRALCDDSSVTASTLVVLNPQSPQTTDQRAIQDCVEAPPSSSFAVRKRKWTTPNRDTSTAAKALSSHLQPSASEMVHPVSVSAPSSISRAQVDSGVQLFSSSSSLLVTPHHHPPSRDREHATKAPPRIISSSKTNKSPRAQTVSPESRPMVTTTVEEKFSKGSSVDGRIVLVLTKPTSSDLTEDKEGPSLLASAKKGVQGDGANASTVNVSFVSAISKGRKKDFVDSSCQHPPKGRGDIRSDAAGPNKLSSLPCTSKEEKIPNKKLKVMKERFETQNDTTMGSIVVSLPVPRKKKRKSSENALGTTTDSSLSRKSPKLLFKDEPREAGTQLGNVKLKCGQSPVVLPTNSKKKEEIGRQSSVSEHRPHFDLALSSEPESTTTAERDDCTPSAKPVSRFQLDTGEAHILTTTSQKAIVENLSLSTREDERMAEVVFALPAPRRNSSPTQACGTSKKSSKAIEIEPLGLSDALALQREKTKRHRDLPKSASTSTTILVKDKAGAASISSQEDGLAPIDEESASLYGIANALCLFKNASPRAKVSVSDASTGMNPNNPASVGHNKLQKFTLSKTVPSSPEDVVVFHHKRLKALLSGLSSTRKLHLSKSSGSHGNVETKQQAARAQLQAHHLAAHELLQKRILQAAEATVRLLGDSVLSYEEATTEIKASIQSYQEILFETLHRQGLEASTLAAEQTSQRRGMPIEAISVSFPFPDVFAKVCEVAEAVSVFSTATKRGPGRPPAAKRDREGLAISH